MRRKIIAVLGDSKIEKGGQKEQLAFELGKALVDNGYRVQSGGLGGVMEAFFRGAKSSEKYREGDTLAIIPSFDPDDANEYADISIATGLDMLRNCIVANADACIALGGGAGTLSEAALAWSMRRLVLAYKNVEGWSSKIADMKLDDKPRYDDIADDRIYGVESAGEVIAILAEKLEVYNTRHDRIGFRR